MDIKLYLDIPASQVLSPSLPVWGRGEGSGRPCQGRGTEKSFLPPSPNPTFSGTGGGRESVSTEGLLCAR